MIHVSGNGSLIYFVDLRHEARCLVWINASCLFPAAPLHGSFWRAKTRAVSPRPWRTRRYASHVTLMPLTHGARDARRREITRHTNEMYEPREHATKRIHKDTRKLGLKRCVRVFFVRGYKKDPKELRGAARRETRIACNTHLYVFHDNN